MQAGQPLCVGVASRSDEPSWARECLRKFFVCAGVSMMDVVTEERCEIYKGSKRDHFAALSRKTGIAYDKMCFFDDDMSNIRDVGEFRSLYAKLAPSEAREQWQLLYDDAARDETSLAPRRSTHFILTGEIFKVWLAADDASLRSTDRHVTLTRTSVTETGERIVGLAVHPDAVERVRKSVAEIEQSSDPEVDHAAVAEVEESSEPPIDPKLFKELERSCEALVKKATKRAALLSKEAEDLDDDFI